MREEPRGDETDDLDGVPGFAQRARTTVEHVEQRGADEARHQRDDDREETGDTRRTPRREQEPDRQCEVEGADVAGGVDGQAGVVAEHESGHRGDDHDDGHHRQRDAQCPLVRGVRALVGPDRRQDRCRQIGNDGRAREPDVAVDGLSIARESPTRRAALEMGSQLGWVGTGVLAIEAGGDGGSRRVTSHAW